MILNPLYVIKLFIIIGGFYSPNKGVQPVTGYANSITALFREHGLFKLPIVT